MQAFFLYFTEYAILEVLEVNPKINHANFFWKAARLSAGVEVNILSNQADRKKR